MIRTLEFYLACPYRRVHELVQESDGSRYYLCRFAELPGIMGTGSSPAGAAAGAFAALEDFLAVLIAENVDVPEPFAGTSSADALLRSRKIDYPYVESLDPASSRQGDAGERRVESADAPDEAAHEGESAAATKTLIPIQQSWVLVPA